MNDGGFIAFLTSQHSVARETESMLWTLVYTIESCTKRTEYAAKPGSPEVKIKYLYCILCTLDHHPLCRLMEDVR